MNWWTRHFGVAYKKKMIELGLVNPDGLEKIELGAEKADDGVDKMPTIPFQIA